MQLKHMLILSVLFFSGCAIVPDSLEVPEGTPLISYNKAVSAGANAQGQTARWGGLIVGVENKPEKTFVEVVHFPLNHYGKPNRGAETTGRFKAQIDGFVDPVVFEEGRLITFLGELTAPTSGMVGEQPYIYPTLLVEDYHMWRNQQAYDVTMFHFNYGTGWYSPFYGRYSPWGPMYGPGFGHSRIRVIKYDDRPRKVSISRGNSRGSSAQSNAGSSDRRTKPLPQNRVDPSIE
jgi:outer membrane lipoprotein